MRPRGADLELGDILLRTTRLSAEQLELARNRQQESHQRLGDVLVEDGLISPDDLLRAIAEQLRLDVLQNLSPDEVDEALIQRVPDRFREAAPNFASFARRRSPDLANRGG